MRGMTRGMARGPGRVRIFPMLFYRFCDWTGLVMEMMGLLDYCSCFVMEMEWVNSSSKQPSRLNPHGTTVIRFFAVH